MSEVWAERFRHMSSEASTAAFHSGHLAAVLETISHMLTIITGVVVLWLGAHMVMAGSITSGALVAVMILTWRVLAPVAMFCNALPRLEQLRQTIAQVDRLMNIPSETELRQDTIKPSRIAGRLEFKSVGLRYSKDTDPVFAGLSFTAQPGQMVAIIGGNGSGKSTILKLMNGLYHPQAGSIRLDGVDIRQLDPTTLRRNINYMPQNPDFFEGTLAENIRLANPLAGDAAILSALKHTGALEEVEAMPLGIATPMGRNKSLSVTLAYRLGLARLCLSETAVILCDELPYAVLNSSSGELFAKLLDSWRGKKTILLVTHREDYVRRCDIAVGLRVGEVPLVGKPEHILQKMKEEKLYA
jgi:ATP-binding cassette, subfamily C, bacterial LapB